MNREARNNLRSIINQSRIILEQDIARRIAYYGIRSDGAFLDISELGYFTADDIDKRNRLEQFIAKEKIGGIATKSAIKRYIEHTGFTYINRIAALRAMEVRGLIQETIIRRDKYGGRSLREMRISEKTNLDAVLILKSSLMEAFDEVSQEIKVLFDTKDPYSLIFPENRACIDVMRLLSVDVREEDWKEDDIIGWIYQYYNEQSRDEFRTAHLNPTSDDIPIITQFYTPDWIVKALVDNTMCHLWHEMHEDTKLSEFCQYYVSRTRHKRTPKPVSEIKIIDPACGSGHFLVYAFDVLYLMYRESEPEIPEADIPSLILKNNLFGIDIDLRASQLTALSLYLKAKTYNNNVIIKKMNIVCADIRISDGARRSKFLERFIDDPPLRNIFERLFQDLNNTFSVGSLLQIRGPFEELFNSRKLRNYAKEIDPKSKKYNTLEQQHQMIQTKFLVDNSAEAESLVIHIPKEHTIESMLEELTNFGHDAIQSRDVANLLFATETEKSIGLLDLLTQKYDIIIMNPPHGAIPLEAKQYLKKNYPRTYYDYYSMFLEQALNLSEKSAMIGALTGRSVMVTKLMQSVREELLQCEGIPEIVLDLGFKTLEEAHARFAAIVFRRRSGEVDIDIKTQLIKFYSLTSFEWDDKRLQFERALKSHELEYVVSLGELAEIQGTPYAYWAPSVLRNIFVSYPALDRDTAGTKGAKIANVKQGLITADTMRFRRFWWEVPIHQIADTRGETKDLKIWVPFAAQFYLFYFYADLPLVVNWKNDGEEIRGLRGEKGKILSRAQNVDFYFKNGLSWSALFHRTQVPKLWSHMRLPFRILPKGTIFSDATQAVIPESTDTLWPLLAICCSKLIFVMSRMITSENKQGTWATAMLPIALHRSTAVATQMLHSLAKEAYDILREWDVGNEISTIFIKPWLINSFGPKEKPITSHPLSKQFQWSEGDIAKKISSLCPTREMSLIELLKIYYTRRDIVETRIYQIKNEIDNVVYSLYNISDEEKLLIEKESASIMKYSEESNDALAEDSNAASDESREQTERLLSYFAKKAIEADEDGILPFDPIFQNNFLQRVLWQINSELANEGGRIEKEMTEILGLSLSEWLEKRFFSFHTDLYMKRPIYWHLTSYRMKKSKDPSAAFSCIVCYSKLTRDTIPKIQGLYLSKIKERFNREKERIMKELESSRALRDKKRIKRLSTEYDELVDRTYELDIFDRALTTLHNPRENKQTLKNNAKWIEKKMAEIRDEGWRPIIGYGVMANIEPLKELKVVHPAADKIK